MSLRPLGRMPLLLVAILILSLIVVAGVYSRSTNKQKPKNRITYLAEEATVPPEVKSKVKGLEIAGVSLVDQGTPYAAIVIDVINHRDQGVTALDFVAYKGDTSGGIAMDGSLAIPPRQLIPPHSLERFTWHLGEIIECGPAYLNAAIFSDGKEEGDQNSLNGINHGRRESQKKELDKKAGNGGQQ